MNKIKTIDLYRYEKSEDQRHTKCVGRITGQEAFDQLEKHLTDVGLLPDEYFSPSSYLDPKKELPEIGEAVCHTNWGGSEGIYIDIYFHYYENKEKKVLPFATGKTLDDSGAGFLKMSRIAAECSMMLNGGGSYVNVPENSYGHDTEEKGSAHLESASKTNPRLENLRAYEENTKALEKAAAEQERNKRASLISQIQALKPRIDELLATGNACLESNIPLTGHAFGMREDYDTHQFFTNSWSHLVGFVGNPSDKAYEIEFLGINGGGACGVYNFRTDGTRVYSVHERDPKDITTPSIGHMERFVKNFDEFENKFYAYVDNVIEKQKKSVDALIDNANQRVQAEHPSANPFPQNEHIEAER